MLVTKKEWLIGGIGRKSRYGNSANKFLDNDYNDESRALIFYGGYSSIWFDYAGNSGRRFNYSNFFSNFLEWSFNKCHIC